MLWQSPKRSWSPSQRAALPLRPLPSPCSIPEGPRRYPNAQLALQPSGMRRRGSHPAACSQHYRHAARCTPRFCPVPGRQRDACRDHRESTAIPVMEMGLWRASASWNEVWEMLGNSCNRRKRLPSLGARAPGKEATCLHTAITFSALRKTAPNYSPTQTAADVGVPHAP